MSQALLPQQGHLRGFVFLFIVSPFLVAVSLTANILGKKIYSAFSPYIFYITIGIFL